MKTGGKLLVVYGGFALIVAAIYYLVAPYEWAGTVLLIAMGVSCIGLAGHLLFRDRRRPEREGDTGNDELGPFPLASAWPLVLALASTLVVLGLIYGSGVWALGLVAFGLGLVGLVRESA